jgi:hypothetical protein
MSLLLVGSCAADQRTVPDETPMIDPALQVGAPAVDLDCQGMPEQLLHPRELQLRRSQCSAPPAFECEWATYTNAYHVTRARLVLLPDRAVVVRAKGVKVSWRRDILDAHERQCREVATPIGEEVLRAFSDPALREECASGRERMSSRLVFGSPRQLELRAQDMFCHGERGLGFPPCPVEFDDRRPLVEQACAQLLRLAGGDLDGDAGWPK